jgi:polygalacturonase
MSPISLGEPAWAMPFPQGSKTNKNKTMKKTNRPYRQKPGIAAIMIVSSLVLLGSVVVQAAPTLPTIPGGTYNITAYGASTGSANNATAIQNAINAASAAGGGTVQIPSGTFLSGPITLKSKINLNLASGATLKMLAYGTYPGSAAFIYGKNLNNIEISGSGIIDGQGSAWWTAYNANNSLARPIMVRFEGCTAVEVVGIKLQNAPTAHVSFAYLCDQVTVNGVTISTSSSSPNTDGFDTEGNNYLFNNCNIACGDDNIAIGAGHNVSQYYVIQNCTFGVGHGCSIGSYTTYGVNHITVTGCTFNGTTSGFRIKSARGRGGVVQYLTYANNTMSKVQYPIWLSEWYPSDPSNPTTAGSASVTSTTPNYKHIVIQNLTATGATSARTIYGVPEQHISDVTLDNVKITATTGMGIYYADGIVFKNGSTITVSSGNPVTIYSATVSGITTHNY